MKQAMVAAMLFGPLVGSCGFAQGAEWVEHVRTNHRVFFYDRGRISNPSPGITGVWVAAGRRTICAV